MPKLQARLWKLIDNPRYHYESFCKLYFEYCDETLFENPKKGLILAEFAPDFAGSVDDVGELRKRELMLQGLAILGGGYRSVGKLDKADSTRHSERLLESARAGMRTIGAFEAVLAGLDLAELYLVDGRWEELEKLTQEIHSDLEHHSGNAEELRAVSNWQERIESRELTLALLEEVKRMIETRGTSPPEVLR